MAIIDALNYQQATIKGIRNESSRTKTFTLQPTAPFNFIAGQHIIVRVAADGEFRTSRHYSFSSAPSSNSFEITIAKAHDGVVSNWFHQKAQVGDIVEITQPLGTRLLWKPDSDSPILLIGGGVGVVPLMSILREHRHHRSIAPVHLLYSARNFEEICFRDELLKPDQEHVTFTLVESIPGDWQHHSGVVDSNMIKPLLIKDQTVYVCGPYGFVQHARQVLTNLGVSEDDIRLENFTLQ